ncbi:hypothetical protein SAMN02799630_00352 [Paenibacillus sp. UNCCL117]|nr:hypothetical protein SAMN04488602_102179 [Paenibacillus sp. cl123]SFW13056.1 hypothetical protein SAMN02799630_00352 [Paenibacillus sp. UNCCL117]
MWESVWMKDQLEVQMDAGSKAVRVRILESSTSAVPHALELDRSGMFELLHTLLTINHSFNNEGSYRSESQPLPAFASSAPSVFSRV